MQQSLLHESITDALREVVQALGGTKVIGAKMRPELPVDHAGRWLADCLNTDRRERLCPEQVLFLAKAGRAAGCHALLNYICRESGYADPVAIEPEDERAKMQREFIEATKSLSAMAARIERLSQPQVIGRAA